MMSNHLILCWSVFLLPSIFPSTRIFSSESALHNEWLKYWSFSFSISTFNEYWGLIPLGLTGLIPLLSKGLSGVFSSTTIWKHQFFGTLPSLLSSSQIHTWLLERPSPWLYESLSAKWYLCFLTHSLGLSLNFGWINRILMAKIYF